MAFAFAGIISAQQLADVLPIGIAIINDKNELISVNCHLRALINISGVKFSECWLRSIHLDDVDRVANAYHETTASKKTLCIDYRTRDPDHLWRSRISPQKSRLSSQKDIAHEAQERKQQQERFIDMISHEIRNPLSAILHCTEDILEAVRGQEEKKTLVSDITEAAETISLCVAHQEKIVNVVLTFSKLDASMLALSPRRRQPKRHFAAPLAIFRPELRKQSIHFEYKLDLSYGECEIDWVMADLDRISQVPINLLSNAIKFTANSENERIVRVSMGASVGRPSSYPPNVVFFDSDEAALRLDATNTKDWGEGQAVYIMIAVHDTGIGISDEAQRRLFQRFSQATPRTESKYGGSGLGLNVSRKLCHLHGGEIGVSSKEGQGSTFGFFFKVRRSFEARDDVSGRYHGTEVDKLCNNIQALGKEVTGSGPLARGPEVLENPVMTRVEEVNPDNTNDERTDHTTEMARQATEACTANNQQIPSAGRDEGTPSRHILLVEDNAINRRIISRKLKASGFCVSEAENGQEALDYVEHVTFDCILMDQEMPLMDGNSATRAIRDREKKFEAHIPVLGVTANVREAQQSEMLDAGMDDIIHKPYGTDEIVQKIKHLIANKLTR
ncbi:uncharacterized protein N7506_005483 [Penicillium brevicompactum]|uniref:uncharacterized protein n=1 Tax=Penicillium brevicompactum TaxID=5074 RepID=UPI00253FFE28|nr:uncharacterized protein N7506_005483 [Penicillium brevicompactum]KAJ5337461.1 hypothetical protein N7506_005483 [Penicillium brevicompactum]